MLSVEEQQAVDYAISLINKKAFRKGTKIESAQNAIDYLSLRLAGLEREVFHVTFLTSQNKIIESVDMFQGTINQSPVFPREIAKRALQLNAGAVILSHNHPSGECKPSEADKQITELITNALNLFDIRVLDHIIIGNGYYSFAEYGLI